MNPAKAYAHLSSPRGGDEADNYRAPGQITFLRSDHVALDAGKLRDTGTRGGVSAIDISELYPAYDVSDTTSRLAACVVLRIMAAIAQSRGELVDRSLRRPAS